MRHREQLIEIRRWHIARDEWLSPWVPPFTDLTRAENDAVTLLVMMVNDGESIPDIIDDEVFETIVVGDVDTIFYLRFPSSRVDAA